LKSHLIHLQLITVANIFQAGTLLLARLLKHLCVSVFPLFYHEDTRPIWAGTYINFVSRRTTSRHEQQCERCESSTRLSNAYQQMCEI
jgi:hypothetical protein